MTIKIQKVPDLNFGRQNERRDDQNPTVATKVPKTITIKTNYLSSNYTTLLSSHLTVWLPLLLKNRSLSNTKALPDSLKLKTVKTLKANQNPKNHGDPNTNSAAIHRRWMERTSPEKTHPHYQPRHRANHRSLSLFLSVTVCVCFSQIKIDDDVHVMQFCFWVLILTRIW